MKTYVAALGALLLVSAAFGQARFEQDYKPIVSKGPLPADLITHSSEKYAAERAKLKNDKGAAKKAKDQFLLESSFELDNLLQSGKVVFNDPMSDYVNKVADKILAKDPETRGKVRFYILKSTYVNAAATNQGIILVNMGLLAQLENEAQLAFILSHELTHYKKKHMITHAVEADKITKGKGSYKTFNKNDKFLATMTFSRELETQADVEGYELFQKTQYSSANLLGVYDVLKYSYLPFDDVAFDKSIFENSTYKIPALYDLKETAPINTKDENDNPKSSHPSIKARRELMSGKLAKADNEGKSDYLVSKEQFELMRTTARFELSRLYTLHHDYEQGLYNSYLLLRKYPNNLYLKKNILECLENLACYARTGSNWEKAHSASKEIEGKGQAVNYLIERMDSTDAKELTVLALAYAAKLKHEYPKDQDIDEHTKYIIRLLAKQDIDLDYFSDAAPKAGEVTEPTATALADSATAAGADTAATPAKNTTSTEKEEETSKYAKIKNQQVEKKQEVKAGKGYYTQYAIVEYYKEPWVAEYFKEAADKKGNNDEAEEVTFSKKSSVSKKVYAMGLDRVLVINPYYARLDANNKHKIRYVKAEGGQRDFAHRLVSCGHKAKLDVEILDARNLASNDIDKMNDITLLEEYVADRLESDDQPTPFPDRQKITELAKKYNTDYFLWTGVVSYKENQKRKITLGVLSAFLPYMLPFTLSYLINGGHYTFYFNMMYDVKTDQVTMANFREVYSRTSPSVLNSHIYDTFMQLHAKPKESKKDDKNKETASK
ncbi:MAG: M48 family metallopeptidase [Bacteroidetes bacterium]|nr:M48 family metallopeptidase [Bacteroidota bacterium]